MQYQIRGFNVRGSCLIRENHEHYFIPSKYTRYIYTVCSASTSNFRNARIAQRKLGIYSNKEWEERPWGGVQRLAMHLSSENSHTVTIILFRLAQMPPFFFPTTFHCNVPQSISLQARALVAYTLAACTETLCHLI